MKSGVNQLPIIVSMSPFLIENQAYNALKAKKLILIVEFCGKLSYYKPCHLIKQMISKYKNWQIGEQMMIV
ncbi:hypothetical protein J2Z83_001722 [Virgibacillus natechei]|uniref:Uncharacterized protein n=1 Tax=Virgibacillus natechei TaxID=1216297 RepID=A0ABS4IFD6_9BACI|nr:hypothetical protein [Virgibacillus natechei]